MLQKLIKTVRSGYRTRMSKPLYYLMINLVAITLAMYEPFYGVVTSLDHSCDAIPFKMLLPGVLRSCLAKSKNPLFTTPLPDAYYDRAVVLLRDLDSAGLVELYNQIISFNFDERWRYRDQDLNKHAGLPVFTGRKSGDESILTPAERIRVLKSREGRL